MRDSLRSWGSIGSRDSQRGRAQVVRNSRGARSPGSRPRRTVGGEAALWASSVAASELQSKRMFSCAEELTPIVRAAVLWWDGAAVVERDPRLEPLLAEAEQRVRAHPPEESGSVRTMYKRVGLDPTKTRPSNEALLRRVRKGQPLPRVNSLVDVINWCSVEFQLPYGLYDRRQVAGDVTLRLGREGEEYAGIRKDTVHVAGRIALVDDRGPFGNPTSDSARTMVTTATRDALVVVFAPRDVEAARLGRVLDTTAARLNEIAGGHEVQRLICT
jgi:DNA/RNA-binding domain of Phe-tRNA-synthetase-like protein